MAAIYWLAATLLGLVLGLAAFLTLVVESTGRAIGVAALVIGSGVAHTLPRRLHAA